MSNQRKPTAERNDDQIKAKPVQTKSRVHPDISYLNDRFDGGSIGEVDQLLERASLHFSQDQVDFAVDDLISAAGRLRDTSERVHTAYKEAIAQLSISGGKSTSAHPRALALIKARKSLPN